MVAVGYERLKNTPDVWVVNNRSNVSMKTTYELVLGTEIRRDSATRANIIPSTDLTCPNKNSLRCRRLKATVRPKQLKQKNKKEKKNRIFFT